MEAILRAYGFVNNGSHDEKIDGKICIASHHNAFADFNTVKCHQEAGKQLYYPRRRWYHLFNSPTPVYHALLPHITFTGEHLQPVWVNKAGRAVIAWHQDQRRRTLLIGLDVEEEIIRHRQGEPAKVDTTAAQDKAMWGYGHERPLYLFEDQIVPEYHTQPWADQLGFFLAETLAQLNKYPLVEPLPQGAKAAVILTGDDDQAFLEKYAEQLQVIGDSPMTYFLHHLTRHTRETLGKFPPNIELGLHPDALDKPEAYDQLCMEQARQIQDLVGRPMRLVRNHGFQSRGYLGHLKAWEENGLKLDVNYPGANGRALTGSFLPMRVRRLDGTWSDHYSLLTPFTDGMIYTFKLSQHQAVDRIRQVARQIEKSYPGTLVFNFHPENIDDIRLLHQEVLALARRPGWVALGLESYLEWLETLDSLRIEPFGEGNFLLASPGSVRDLVLRYPVAGGWHQEKLEPWSGKIAVCFNRPEIEQV